MGKVISLAAVKIQRTDEYFKPNKKFYSMDGKQLSQHQMIQKGYEPVTRTGKIIKAIVSPLGYAFGLIIAVITFS